MTGVASLLRILFHTQRRRLVVWALVLVGGLAFTAIAVARLYDTAEEVASYGEAVVSDALVAINGRVEGIDSLGGIIQDEFGFLASFLMPLAGIALVTSMTRAEEESGRLEAVQSGRIDRRAPVVAAMVLVTGTAVLVAVGFVASLLAAGIGLGPAVLYSVALGMVSLVFAAYAAVCAQVVAHGRGVYFLGFAAIALSYVLRGVGDVNHSFWVWLSPLGWLEKAAPFASVQRWWVLVIPLAVALALTGLAVVLADRRDLGSALYRPGPGPASAASMLTRPTGLAAHSEVRPLLGWLIGAVAFAAVMGALAQEAADAILGNPSLSSATGITEQNAAAGFLAISEVYLAVIACGFAVAGLASARREESLGRLEPMLAGTVGRRRWLAAQQIVVVAGLITMVLLAALALGVTTSLSTGVSGYFGTTLKSGLAYLPAELVVAGLATLLYGAAPRAFALAWAAFGFVTFIGLLGAGLQLPQWVLDLSPLTHVGNPPDGGIQPAALVVLTSIAVVLAAGGFVGFRRRQIPQI